MTFGGPFECRKRPLFTSFLRIPTIFWFFIFLRFWWGKRCLGSFFAFLTKNWPKNMYYSVRWPKSAVWPFLTSWPEMTLTWPIGYKALEWSFEVSGTRFMPIYWLLIRFCRYFAWQSRCPERVNNFHCDLTCDVIDDPRSIKFVFPRQIFQGYRTAFEFWKSAQ